MKPADTRAALERLGVRPSRALGQNFLVDEGMAAAIVGELEPCRDDVVIEVGPGLGALTDHLEGRVRKLVLVELDERLAANLEERFRGRPDVEVVRGDGARIDLRRYFPEQPVKFIGNLPYSAGGAILRNFLDQPTPVSRGVVMLQREVADRICAGPGSADYGVLSLRVQASWRPKRVRNVPPEVFQPRPEVDSSVLLLIPRPREEFPPFDERLFDRLIRMGFAQRRKQLRKLLPDEARAVWAAFAERHRLPVAARAQELSLDQWVALAVAADPHPLAGHAQHADEVFDVVDDANRVVGTARRADVHARGLRHRAVHVFVFNARGELFLQKRSHLKDAHPGVWDSSAAGHLDSGEDYESAAAREIREELGLAAPLRRVGDIAAAADTGWEFVALFEGTSQEQPRWPAAEIETGRHFPMPVVAAWAERRPQDFAPGFIRCLRLWQAATTP